MAASYHNHTTWSDGKGTVAEMVAAARVLGLEEVGISDHWALHAQGWTRRSAMDPDRLGDYVAEVRAAGDGEPPIVRLGLEVDWLPDNAEAIASRLGEHDFDFLIGSVHEVNGFRYDISLSAWEALRVEERDEMHRRYWRNLADMARSGLFDVVGHLDLPKKLRQRPSVDIGGEITAALDAIAAADMAVELNTAGWFRPCEEQYPSEALLRVCRARGIPALVTADAHRPEQLDRELVRGAAKLREVGYREVVRFENRKRMTVALR